MAQSNTTDDLRDKATGQFKKIADRIEGVASSASTQLGNASDSASEVADNLNTAVHKSVKSQPIATLAMAAGLGFVLGALWKS